jgi:hypothetical protein
MIRPILTLGLFALALAIPASARSQVVIQNRFVTVRAGGGQGTFVQVGNPVRPIVTVVTPASPSPGPLVQSPDGVPLEIAPPGKPVPLPARDPSPPPPGEEIPKPMPKADGASKTIRALTPHEFACVFKPECGSYEVYLIHPCTGCPVKVCFTLRPCCRGVIDHGNRLEFDYGCFLKDTVIRFNRNGGVHVRN